MLYQNGKNLEPFFALVMLLSVIILSHVGNTLFWNVRKILDICSSMKLALNYKCVLWYCEECCRERWKEKGFRTTTKKSEKAGKRFSVFNLIKNYWNIECDKQKTWPFGRDTNMKIHYKFTFYIQDLSSPLSLLHFTTIVAALHHYLCCTSPLSMLHFTTNDDALHH